MIEVTNVVLQVASVGKAKGAHGVVEQIIFVAMQYPHAYLWY